MIHWDAQYKQILTSKCLQCPDQYFAPYSSEFPHVGCCSHSPAFTLFEIHKMLLQQYEEFFWEKIYHNPNNTIKNYQITIHAEVASQFQELDKRGLSSIQKDDLRLRFSICQYFELGKGCGLNPIFKNQVCRSFICGAVEDGLEIWEQEKLKLLVKQIGQEVEHFNSYHENLLRAKGWTFHSDMPSIVRYLAAL